MAGRLAPTAVRAGAQPMRHIAGVAAAAALIVLAGCSTGTGATASRGSPARTGVPVAPALPSVVALGCSTWQTRSGSVLALVHVQTLLNVRHARGPQQGAHGRVTVSSMDVAFLAGGAPVGWAIQATPPGTSGLVLGNGKALMTATIYRLYLSGGWTPHCRVMRVYWLPGDHP
jgi:hypothetical protein